MEKDFSQDFIAILDFGSQYTQLIARRIRECNVFCEIYNYNISPDELHSPRPSGIVLSGGPASVVMQNPPLCDVGIFNLGIPILGICYGMQVMGRLLGGKVVSSAQREYGFAKFTQRKKSVLFYGLSKGIQVWMSHGDRVSKLPKGFESLGSTPNSNISAMADPKRRFFGLQFHPEVIHTPNGKDIFKNFLFRVCNCKPTWTMKSYVRTTISQVKKTVGSKKVICALSGGVDSSVLSVLLHRALGHRLICIFVNNGLLRKNEVEMIIRRFKHYYRINLKYVDAENSFLRRLKGIVDPELKRRIIGNEFIRVFEKVAKSLGNVRYLAQGTLYPDWIESRSAFGGPSAKIKTHHNVGGLPAKMRLQLIEPFKYLFKDEVRLVGKELGLPDEIVYRQPFPGPGLAVRVIGEVTKPRLKVLREADWIVVDEIKKAGLYKDIWQSFCVLLPVKSVGVMGDERTYEDVIAIRAVNSVDGMTADWCRLPNDLLARISNRIINEVKGVNRVVYDISSKPPSTIEWE